MDALTREIVVSEDIKGTRLDLFVASSLGYSRSFVQKLIVQGCVTINGFPGNIKPSTRISYPDRIVLTIPETKKYEIIPEKVDFQVVFEDDHVIVIDKPEGLVVHPGHGNWKHTLVHGLLYRFPDIKNEENDLRPGIVHRLDSTTSGLMVVAKTKSARLALQEQFQKREVSKTYLALTREVPEEWDGYLDLPIGRDPVNRLRMAVLEEGKKAQTFCSAVWTKKKYSLLKCRILTGRTHQIRVHLKYAGFPVAGDRLYGYRKRKTDSVDFNRTFLHSWSLGFYHPASREKMLFTRALPEDLIEILQKLSSSKED